MFLPCGHDFNVVDLDTQLGLGNVFDIGIYGDIMAIKSAMAQACKQTPRCPQCSASCASVPRYRHIGQFQLAPDTLERLYSKLGRKMRTLARNVQDYRKNLQKGSEWFCENFEPGPLQGKANAEMIKTRLLFIVPLETAITRYRDQVLVRVEEDITRTALLLGNTYTPVPVKLSFKIRLDLLYLHCRLTVVQEAAKIIQFLRNLDNPRHTEHMVKVLRMHTIQEIYENKAATEVLVNHCRCHSLLLLEAEAILLQLNFDSVSECLGGVGNNLGLRERAEQLIDENPGTVGRLRACYEALDPYTKDRDSVVELWTSKTRELWEKWGDYEMGSLVYCKSGHPYSRKAFPDCPECGGRKGKQERCDDREVFVKTLDRDSFLKTILTKT
ncbi:MAG: hypothetical protein Q9204_000101 [Flavoplaca sp. TL-2023a]